MISIKDKKDSINKMKELGLNYFPLEVFGVKDIDGIKAFFQKYPAEEYILRDPSKPNGKFYFVKDYDEASKLIGKFTKDVTIDVSYNPFKEDIVLVGDIKVSKNSNSVDLTARDDIEATHRNIYENPKYNFHTSLDDDRVWRVNGFDKIMHYIVEHELYDVIVEFSVYSCKLGIKKENVVISEIRTSF